MFHCPHCNKPVESAPPDKVSHQEKSWSNSGETQVTLGCSTLILIAIIVSMFSPSNDDSRALRELKHEIQVLEKKIDEFKK